MTICRGFWCNLWWCFTLFRSRWFVNIQMWNQILLQQNSCLINLLAGTSLLIWSWEIDLEVMGNYRFFILYQTSKGLLEGMFLLVSLITLLEAILHSTHWKVVQSKHAMEFLSQMMVRQKYSAQYVEMFCNQNMPGTLKLIKVSAMLRSNFLFFFSNWNMRGESKIFFFASNS